MSGRAFGLHRSTLPCPALPCPALPCATHIFVLGICTRVCASARPPGFVRLSRLPRQRSQSAAVPVEGNLNESSLLLLVSLCLPICVFALCVDVVLT